MRRITEADIANPEFIRDLKNYTAALAETQGLTCYNWLDWLTDEYRDLQEPIVDGSGRLVFLNMEVFELPETDTVPSISYWFRDFCTRVPPHVRPHVRVEVRDRVIVLATILMARDPTGTRHFGQCPDREFRRHSYSPISAQHASRSSSEAAP
nr:hypothetical protein [uncultured Hyphomonas sp.]